MSDDCKFTGEELSAFADGELDAAKADAVAAHLAACGSCAREVAEYRRLDETSAETFPAAAGKKVPAERWNAMWQSISAELDRADKSPGAKKVVRLTWQRVLAAAAIILIAVALVILLPWGKGAKKDGDVAVKETPARVVVNEYSDGYDISIEETNEAIVISLTEIPKEEKGS